MRSPYSPSFNLDHTVRLKQDPQRLNSRYQRQKVDSLKQEILREEEAYKFEEEEQQILDKIESKPKN